MAKRRFEFVEGASSKFWEVEVTGVSHTVQYGRIGTNGQIKTKTFPTPEEATLDADRLTRERVAKGFREPANAGASGAPLPLRYTLTQSNPDSIVMITHDGSRLITNGVVQDFASRGAATEHLERVISLRKRDGYAVSVPEPVGLDAARPTKQSDENVAVTSADGNWTVTFRGEASVPDAACVTLLRRLSQDAPKRVQVICDLTSPGAHWTKAIAGRRFSSVHAFVFDTHFQTQTRQANNSIGELAPTFGAFPSLERAFVTGKLALKACKHPTLRELHLLGEPLTESFLRGLGASELPALTRLVVSLAQEAEPAPTAVLVDALHTLRAPLLREVHLEGVGNVPGLLEGLLARDLPSSWRVLSVAGALDDEDRLLAVLGAHKARLAQLDVLALPLADDVSEGGAKAVRKLHGNVQDTETFHDLALPAAYAAW